MKYMSTISQVGNGLQQIGQWKAKISLYLSPLIAILFIVAGIYIRKQSKGDGVHTMSATGTLVNPPPCAPKQFCNASASYQVNSNTYTVNGQFTVPNGGVAPSTIPVLYNPNNPADATTSVPPPQFMGIIFIVVGCIIPFISYAIYYATMQSKLFAQIEGGEAVVGAGEAIFGGKQNNSSLF